MSVAPRGPQNSYEVVLGFSSDFFSTTAEGTIVEGGGVGDLVWRDQDASDLSLDPECPTEHVLTRAAVFVPRTFPSSNHKKCPFLSRAQLDHGQPQQTTCGGDLAVRGGAGQSASSWIGWSFFRMALASVCGGRPMSMPVIKAFHGLVAL